MLDLSVFAIGLVIGWAALFLQFPGPRAGVRPRVRVVAVWLGWALAATLMAHATDAAANWMVAGLCLGLAGHAMLLLVSSHNGGRA